MKSTDKLYMRQALRLAKKGMGWTFPNPMVGAVLVKNGKIIGLGYHKKVGSVHAECEAFQNAIEDTKDSTLYVNLEPCSHYGRTPPCTDEIIKRKLSQVVCAVKDPNPLVSGRGLAILKRAGINVSIGLLEKEAKQLNEGFFTFHQKQRPFVTLKFAASLDGKIATKTGDSKWITNEKERAYSRSLRSAHHGVLVGINTIIHDNPNLGAREKGKKDPLRIILDSTLKIPLESDVLRDTNVLLITTARADKKRLELLQKRGIEVLSLQRKDILIPDVLKQLYKKEIISIFVEGGAETLGSFADAKLADRIYACFAPIIIGGRDAVSAVKGDGVTKVIDALRFKNISFKKFDDNLVVIGTRDTIVS